MIWIFAVFMMLAFEATTWLYMIWAAMGGINFFLWLIKED